MRIKKRYFVAIALFIGVVVVCAACFASAWYEFFLKPSIMTKEKTEAGYQRADPIIKALEQYHTDHGSYPDDLQALVPDYLQSTQNKDWQNIGEGSYEVEADGSGYELKFNYTGPCVNTYSYSSDTLKWYCGGYC